MKIVVIGGTGLIGSKLVSNLRQRGHELPLHDLQTCSESFGEIRILTGPLFRSWRSLSSQFGRCFDGIGCGLPPRSFR
jgi:prephenate dehydrogenase